MSLEFISRRETREHVSHWRAFHYRRQPGAGFSFPCTAQGVLLETNPSALKNFEHCVAGDFDVVDDGVRTERWDYTEPAVVRCTCGAKIVLDDGMTNQCSRCMLLVNGSGQILNPPSMWEPEDRYAVFGPQNVPDEY